MPTTLLPVPHFREVRQPSRVGKTYLIRTFGCQMNEHDSERIAGLFEGDGLVPTDRIEDADIVYINTCTIRENADNRLYGTLGNLKVAKDAKPGLLLVVGGCAAQKDRETVRERAPWVDVVLGTHNLDRVVDLLDHAEAWGPITEVVDELQAMPSSLPTRREMAHSAWVTIQVGCNNTCTFCIVPSVRGPEISRRPGDVLREVTALVAEGVVEVTLLGQNVDTYGRDLAIDGHRRPIFADLLRQVGAIDGIRRVRFTSPHPNDFNSDVAAAMAETPAVCEQLHFPLQSGSDKILASMHRGYNRVRFLGKLAMARDIIPDLSVSTDVIVGYPGESEDDFQRTLEVLEEARFDQAFTFIFSPRPGTAAASRPADFVDPETVKIRFDRLLAIQNGITAEKSTRWLGRRLEVLSEGESKKRPDVSTTRSRGGKVVHVEGRYDAGVFIDVEIVAAAHHHLTGVPN